MTPLAHTSVLSPVQPITRVYLGTSTQIRTATAPRPQGPHPRFRPSDEQANTALSLSAEMCILLHPTRPIYRGKSDAAAPSAAKWPSRYPVLHHDKRGFHLRGWRGVSGVEWRWAVPWRSSPSHLRPFQSGFGSQQRGKKGRKRGEMRKLDKTDRVDGSQREEGKMNRQGRFVRSARQLTHRRVAGA